MNEQNKENPKTITASSIKSSGLLGKIYEHGKVFRARNKTFGTHDLLCLQVPDKAEGKVRFFSLYRPDTMSKNIQEGLLLSSVKDDRVSRTWNSLEEYFA